MIKWYASTENILLMGPYASQEAAYEKMRLTDDEARKQRSPYPVSLRVWPASDDCINSFRAALQVKENTFSPGLRLLSDAFENRRKKK